MNLEQFKDWALQQVSVAKYTDGQYQGECVSLINQYLARVYGISAGAWGHAFAWANSGNAVRTYFDQVGNLLPGDIIVYDSRFGGGYGHIAIYLGNGQMLDQNGDGNGRIAIRQVWPNHSTLRRKGTNQGSEEMATPEQVDLAFQAAFNRQATTEEIRQFQGQPVTLLLQHVLKYNIDFRTKAANFDPVYAGMLHLEKTLASAYTEIDRLRASGANPELLKQLEAASAKIEKVKEVVNN